MSTATDTRYAEWMDSLDPTLREAARGYLRELLETMPADRSLSAAEHDLRSELLGQIKHLPDSDAPIPIPVVAMVTFFAAFVAMRSSVPAVLFAILLFGLLTGLWSFSQRANRKLFNENFTKAVLDAALPGALSCVSLTRTERAYMDCVRELLPRANETAECLPGELRREQMAQLNTLLDSGRRLDGVCGEIASALAAASPASLQEEADRLRQRQERATDPGTRDAFAQSVALCEERLRRAETLDSLTERIEAEQELVYQAFRAAQSGIAALRVSPTAASLDSGTGAASVADIADTIGRQTRAVEAAVQELGIRR